MLVATTSAGWGTGNGTHSRGNGDGGRLKSLIFIKTNAITIMARVICSVTRCPNVLDVRGFSIWEGKRCEDEEWEYVNITHAHAALVPKQPRIDDQICKNENLGRTGHRWWRLVPGKDARWVPVVASGLNKLREVIVFETFSTWGRGKASQCGCCRAGSELLEQRPRRRASRTQGPCWGIWVDNYVEVDVDVDVDVNVDVEHDLGWKLGWWWTWVWISSDLVRFQCSTRSWKVVSASCNAMWKKYVFP